MQAPSPADRPFGSPPRPPVLVVDDEESLRFWLQIELSQHGYEALLASDGREALRLLEARPDVRVVLSDVRMPGMDGLALLEALAGRGLSVVLMSAYGSWESQAEAVRRGAADFISKPFTGQEVRLRLERVLAHDRLETELSSLREELAGRWDLKGFIGQSPAAQAVMDAVRRVASYPSTVLFTGESGTGKELLARAVHHLSPRAQGPFVAINCAAIPEGLLESELFGHERGAFTGAYRSRAGVFEQADGGTLLLDEIGDMPVQLQSRLLRVLEDGRVRRVGGNADLAVDARVVAATAASLETAVAEGSFREDLFYRLNVVRVHIPALRARREDVPLLAEALVRRAALRLGCPAPTLSPEALRALMAAPWPGNVRQLEHALERAVILCKGQVIAAEDLPPEVLSPPAPPPTPREDSEEEDLSIKQRTAKLERSLILQALARTGGNRTQAARLLEISYKALVYKIRDYGIET